MNILAVDSVSEEGLNKGPFLEEDTEHIVASNKHDYEAKESIVVEVFIQEIVTFV